jgi:uncharacterized membrane protein YeaQ/YmgE (transglycosylase-associated protein family)
LDSLVNLVCFVAIGIAAGWLAGVVMKGRGFGPLVDFALGVVGAIVGGLLFRIVGLAAYGLIAQLIMAVIGAVVVLLVVRAIKKA